jgi:transcriptional regulator with XRE-family HTH domain
MSTETAQTLGAVVRARRRELGLTQEQLAERISGPDEYIRQSDISRIERGDVGLPRRQRLERLATALELPIGELLERSGWSGSSAAFAAGQTGAWRHMSAASRAGASSANGASVEFNTSVRRFNELRDELTQRSQDLAAARDALRRTRARAHGHAKTSGARER